MKTLMALLTSLMVTAASGAFAQSNSDSCHNYMTSCADQCTTRPSKGLQDSCTRTCEANANICYSQMYGNPSAGRPQGPQDALNSAGDPVKKSKSSR